MDNKVNSMSHNLDSPYSLNGNSGGGGVGVKNEKAPSHIFLTSKNKG